MKLNDFIYLQQFYNDITELSNETDKIIEWAKFLDIKSDFMFLRTFMQIDMYFISLAMDKSAKQKHLYLDSNELYDSMDEAVCDAKNAAMDMFRNRLNYKYRKNNFFISNTEIVNMFSEYVEAFERELSYFTKKSRTLDATHSPLRENKMNLEAIRRRNHFFLTSIVLIGLIEREKGQGTSEKIKEWYGEYSNSSQRKEVFHIQDIYKSALQTMPKKGGIVVSPEDADIVVEEGGIRYVIPLRLPILSTTIDSDFKESLHNLENSLYDGIILGNNRESIFINGRSSVRRLAKELLDNPSSRIPILNVLITSEYCLKILGSTMEKSPLQIDDTEVYLMNESSKVCVHTFKDI